LGQSRREFSADFRKILQTRTLSHSTAGRSAACAAINFAAAFGYCRGNHERGDALRQRKFHHDWQMRGRAPKEGAQAGRIGAPMALL
jgi:hypothetical protein